jgi:hypothetical protein
LEEWRSLRIAGLSEENIQEMMAHESYQAAMAAEEKFETAYGENDCGA